ncbi:MOSC domain-containing protein [Saccharibacillus sp. CPCC 101409]|uniref:MOSC domain-containing protein n=1 Tax=Saccharibacillus sp. CPCC 101409 TaxID=3058041 RepID=UPI0026713B6C|nr:MOSC domain-containing protein [Saccharibacillus sp. CPCC 101409]MDO3409726.1 MOSC domain-containing protein [Saccharibacillus sp. CPCC 101409]
MQICSLNIGKIECFEYEGKQVLSAITKKSTKKQVFLSALGFQGDEQANKIRHGGSDKAVCAYPVEYYRDWERELERELPFGSFGENLTVQGMRESEVHVGDIFDWGDTKLEVTQPRPPCHKLAKKFNYPRLPVLFQELGRTGFLMRVLQEGWVSIESPVVRSYAHPAAISIEAINEALYTDIPNKELLMNILKLEALSPSVVTTFKLRLAGHRDDSSNRLHGM